MDDIADISNEWDGIDIQPPAIFSEEAYFNDLGNHIIRGFDQTLELVPIALFILLLIAIHTWIQFRIKYALSVACFRDKERTSAVKEFLAKSDLIALKISAGRSLDFNEFALLGNSSAAIDALFAEPVAKRSRKLFQLLHSEFEVEVQKDLEQRTVFRAEFEIYRSTFISEYSKFMRTRNR